MLTNLTLVNPSDDIVFDASDKKVAALAVIIMGNGKYGAKDEAGETVVPVWIFGWRRPWEDLYPGEKPEKAMIDNKAEVCKALRSFRMRSGGEPTSMADICQSAQEQAEWLESQEYEEPEEVAM